MYRGGLWEIQAVWEWDSLETSMVLIESYFRMIRWRFTGFDSNQLTFISLVIIDLW